MAFVVDASVLVKLVVDEGDQQIVFDMLGDDDLTAPAFARVEVANILWKKRRLGHITPSQAERALEVVSRRAVRLIDDGDLLAGALSIAMQIDHPVYDCLYVVAAWQAALPLITADKRLYAGANRAGVEARMVR